MSKKKALGQGLDALIGGGFDYSEPDSTEAAPGIRNLPPAVLKPNPNQPRVRFDQQAIEELAESIRQQGIIQPILAEEQTDGQYLIIAGERRWRAAVHAELEEVPVIVRQFTEQQRLEIALVENIQRENLSPLEEANAYYRMMDELNLSQQAVADKVGKKRSTVANSVRLLKLPEVMKQALSEGVLSSGHARALLSLTNPADMDLLFDKIVQKALSVRAAEAAASNLNGGIKKIESAAKSPRAAQEADPDMNELKQKLIDRLGTRVDMKGDFSKGRMEISWFSRDDLDRLYDILLGDDRES